jgi:hypothetical protein
LLPTQNYPFIGNQDPTMVMTAYKSGRKVGGALKRKKKRGGLQSGEIQTQQEREYLEGYFSDLLAKVNKVVKRYSHADDPAVYKALQKWLRATIELATTSSNV